MRKRLLLVGVILLFLPLLLSGCGIAQEQYDAVVAQLSGTQQKLQSANSELETMRAKVSELTSDLEKTQAEIKAAQDKVSELTAISKKTETELKDIKTEKSELETSLGKSQSELLKTKSDYESFRTDIKSKWDSFDKVSALEYYIVGYWSYAAKQDIEKVESMTAKMIAYIKPVGDSTMNTLWEQAMETSDEVLFLESFAALMDRNSSLFKERAKAVRDMLAE